MPYRFPYRVAVRRDWPEAQAILDKVIASLTPKEQSAIRRKWMPLQGAALSFRNVLLAALPIAIAAAILTLLIANRRLSRVVAEQKQTAAALRASEERWSFALEGARDGVWDWDLTTNAVFFSRQWKAMLGYAEDELEDHFEVWTKRVHPDDLAAASEGIQRHLRGESPAYQVEHRMLCKDGSYRWILARGRIVSRDKNGEPARMVGTHTDVTSWHEAEAKLRESEQRYREIFEHTSDAIFVVEVQRDGEFRYGAFNAATQRFFERSPRELEGLSVEEVVSAADAAVVKANYRRCIAAGASIAYEEQIHFPSGTGIFHTTLVPVREADGQFRRLIGISHDITDRRRAEEQLRRYHEELEELVAERTAELAQSEARFRALSELIPNHVWSAGPDGRIDYVNARAVEYFDRSMESFIGHGWQEVIHPDDLPETMQLWTRSLETGETLDLEYRMRRRDGEYRWHICRARPMRDSEGRILKWFGTTTEIEEQKRVEHVLEQAKAAAEAAARAKSAFLANMSHEIRTPMNAILGFSRLMLRESGVTGQQRQNLETIHRSGEHLLALINDILEMSKIEARHVELREDAFDLHGTLDDLERMFQLRAEERRLSFSVECVGEVPRFVHGDEAKLRQVFINLIGNAVKFTEQGGVLARVRVSEFVGEKVRLHAEIVDTGPGIAADELPRLFQQFEQTALGRRAGGTGLGLAISREFVRLMGGEIHVTSELGRGPTFRLEFIVGVADVGAIKPRAVRRRVVRILGATEPIRILIADDKPENSELLQQTLEAAGFETKVASDGETAVAAFTAWHPRVVLMDLRMPGLDGLEAIRQIRQQQNGLPVAIIAVSASVFEEDRQQALAAGGDDFLSKPLVESLLFAKLKHFTGVEYEYADAPETKAVEKCGPKLTPAALASVLSEEKRAALRTATLSADFDGIVAIAAEIGKSNPEIAAALRHRVESFDYQSILELLEPAGT